MVTRVPSVCLAGGVGYTRGSDRLQGLGRPGDFVMRQECLDKALVLLQPQQTTAQQSLDVTLKRLNFIVRCARQSVPPISLTV